MSNPRAPKCPDSLKDKVFSNTLRQKLEIQEHVLVSKFGDWSLSGFIDDGLLIQQAPATTGHSLYSETIDAMEKVIVSEDCPKGEKTYTAKFLKYLDQAQTKRNFLLLYKAAERKIRIEESRAERDEEVEITSNVLVGENLREEREKKRLAEASVIYDNRPLKVVVKEKSYTIQSPSTSASTNVPIIETENVEALRARVDLCIGTNFIYASPELLQQHKEIIQKHRLAEYLGSIEGARDLFDRCVVIEKDKFIDKISQLTYTNSDFNRFIKFSMIDFGVNCLRISPVPINDERTMFVEIVIQLWKYFGNITGLVCFKWCEKKDKDSATAIFFTNQTKHKTCLLDGMGINTKHVVNTVFESSGLNTVTNIDHTLEDSVKNIKSATDALVTIMSKYPNASTDTLKDIHVYSVHIIQNTMTTIQYVWKDVNKWTVLECGSALLPTTYDERKSLIQLYDLFAFLYQDLEKQKIIFQKLEDENLGYIRVDEDKLISKISIL